jgi:hypothetical protein
MKMGYRDLQKILDVSLPELQKDPFRFSYIHCLREINGNLDTIALCQRALVELTERHVKAQEKIVSLLLMIDGPAEAEALLEKWGAFMAKVQALSEKQGRKKKSEG